MRKEDIHPRTSEGAGALFLDVIKNLNDDSADTAVLSSALEKICVFFSFGCAFVYESDHTGALHLQERYAAYKNLALREEFKLSDVLTREENNRLYRAPIIFFTGKGASPYEQKLAGLFEAGTLLLMPVTDGELSVVGFVGLVDRRSSLSVNEEELALSKTLFSAIASRVKLRVYKQRLYHTQNSLESVMDNTGIEIYVKDFYTDEILYANAAISARLGGSEKLAGKTCYKALYGEDAAECDFCPKSALLDAEGIPNGSFSCDYRRPTDGLWFKMISAAFRWVDGRLAQIVSAVDITANKKGEDIMKRMAYIDHLTGIPNRRMLEKDFEEFMAQPQKDKNATIMFVDLDHFKEINDDFGHQTGDKLLISIARFLQYDSIVKGKAYRYGGDEFLLFFNGYHEREAEVAASLLKSFERPWIIEGNILKIGASIGIARFPQDADDYKGLIDKADMAMYKAKALGRGGVEFIWD